MAEGFSDGSAGFMAPHLSSGLNFRDYGSYGLKQYSGWVREEFLTELVGLQAARAYREMLDNSSGVGSMMFAIIQAMRKVQWHVEPANDSAEAQKEADFADSLRNDMSHTWEDFITESLSMLGYGFSIHELVYKKRIGGIQKLFSGDQNRNMPSSKFDDGRIGWRRLPIRGQDTVIKWFFDNNGQVTGVTQQPWTGTLLDIPIEKFLLFRPSQHKNNPEGKSVLRNAYRSHYFVKRLEELEAIMVERMGGFPVMYVPSALIDKAGAATSPGQPVNPDVAAAQATYQMYKNIVTGVRINDQMGCVLPSDPWKDSDGKVSSVKQYEFVLATPQHSRAAANSHEMIERHKIDILMTLLADFLHMGHEVRGTNNLAVTKVDMFFGAVEAWLEGIAGVMNRYALPRVWELNALNRDIMPMYKPNMPTRMDLDGLGAFINNIAGAGMALFPNDELEEYIRDAAGFPEIEDNSEAKPIAGPDSVPPPAPGEPGAKKPAPKNKGNRPLRSGDDFRKWLKGEVAQAIKDQREP
jgi:hypothetical protein